MIQTSPRFGPQIDSPTDESLEKATLGQLNSPMDDADHILRTHEMEPSNFDSLNDAIDYLEDINLSIFDDIVDFKQHLNEQFDQKCDKINEAMILANLDLAQFNAPTIPDEYSLPRNKLPPAHMPPPGSHTDVEAAFNVVFERLDLVDEANHGVYISLDDLGEALKISEQDIDLTLDEMHDIFIPQEAGEVKDTPLCCRFGTS